MKHKSEDLGTFYFITVGPLPYYVLKHTPSNCETQAKVCCTKLRTLRPVILSLFKMQTVSYSTRNRQYTAIH